MNYYSYKMTFDFGFAPNPFGGFCTLATCKPHIRKRALINDWIIGTGGKTIGLENHLIFLMKITDKIKLEDYWVDSRFQYKKPIINGSLVQIHGDNIYSKDLTNNWIQSNSRHSYPNGETNLTNLKTDVSGEYVLISDYFFYFGNSHFKIPNEYNEVCCKLRDFTLHRKTKNVCEDFIVWLNENYEMGINGDPIHWESYNQMSLW